MLCVSTFYCSEPFKSSEEYDKMISPLLYGTIACVYIGKCIFSMKDNLDLIWAAFGA